MSIEIRVPALPESIADATLVAWHKQPGEAFKRDENLADLETDKVVLEVPAPADGVMGEQKFAVGATVTEGQVLAQIEAGAAPTAGAAAKRSGRTGGTRRACRRRQGRGARRCREAQPQRPAPGRGEQDRSGCRSGDGTRWPPDEGGCHRLPGQEARCAAAAHAPAAKPAPSAVRASAAPSSAWP